MYGCSEADPISARRSRVGFGLAHIRHHRSSATPFRRHNNHGIIAVRTCIAPNDVVRSVFEGQGQGQEEEPERVSSPSHVLGKAFTTDRSAVLAAASVGSARSNVRA